MNDAPTPCTTPHNRAIFEATIEHSRGPDYTIAVEDARRVCLTGCDFATRRACFRRHRDGEGVVAALTELERNGKPQMQHRETCGTAAGATAHYKHKETACDPCRAAMAARKRNKGVAECGTDSGYHRHKRVTKTEPCDACRAAHAVVEQRRAQRKKAEA